MPTPAEFTILVLLVCVGAGLWMVFERLEHVQREIEAIRRKLGDDEQA